MHLRNLKCFLSVTIYWCAHLAQCDGAKILFLSPITSPSHTNFFKPVVKALAERNHTITYWNGLKPDKSLMVFPNVRTLYSESVGAFNVDHNIDFGVR